MELDSISKGIINAFKVLGVLIGLIGIGFVVLFVYLVITGSIYEVAQNGTLPITNGTNVTLAQAEAGLQTTYGYVIDGFIFAGSLIAVAVVLLVFGGFIYGGYWLYKSAKGDKGPGGAY